MFGYLDTYLISCLTFKYKVKYNYIMIQITEKDLEIIQGLLAFKLAYGITDEEDTLYDRIDTFFEEGM